MFIEITLFSILFGYMLKGDIKNLSSLKFKALPLVFISFGIEGLIIFLMRNGFIQKGIITILLNLLMYGILFLFILLNKNVKCISIIGIGFLLNSFAIFANNGAMPVSSYAVVSARLSPDISSVRVSNEGLYTLIDNSTRLWFLGDIIPKPFLRASVISIGDIVSGIGLFLLIIITMKNQSMD